MKSSRAKSESKSAGGIVRALPVHYGSDAALAHALAEGQAPAAAAAWDRFAQVIRSLLWKALGPGAEIDDLLQDVFITLFRRARDLRDPNALGSFVVGIAVRTARSELRRRRVRRWVSLTADGSLPDVEIPHKDFSGRAAVRKLYGILDELDSEARLAFVLRHAEGLELTEIATALDCSLATVKRRLAKASERVLVRSKRDPDLAQWVERSSEPPPVSGPSMLPTSPASMLPTSPSDEEPSDA
jgi:RNA polymerase sigma-70 factor (ECF subfamily)